MNLPFGTTFRELIYEHGGAFRKAARQGDHACGRFFLFDRCG
jgi:hypothetical protein